MNREELAWAAGFLDGEGYFACTGRSDRPHRRLTVAAAQVHLEPLDRLKALLGGGIHGPYPSRHMTGQPYYQWQICSFEQVQAAIAALWAFMSPPKRAQAQAALGLYAEWLVEKESRRVARLRSHCQRGHEFTGANVIIKQDRRRCRACDNANQRKRYRIRADELGAGLQDPSFLL